MWLCCCDGAKGLKTRKHQGQQERYGEQMLAFLASVRSKCRRWGAAKLQEIKRIQDCVPSRGLSCKGGGLGGEGGGS